MVVYLNSDKKAAEYLADAQSCCFLFQNHSLSDVIGFYPLFLKFCDIFSNKKCVLCVSESVFPLMYGQIVSVNNLDENQYDYLFAVSYGGDGKTKGGVSKNSWCAKEELGISWTDADEGKYHIEFAEIYNPFIAVDFNSVLDELSCSRQVAQKICEIVVAHGYLPIDVHYFDFEPSYVPSYSFIDNSATKYILGNTYRLMEILSCCYAYIGVEGDSQVLASSLLGNYCLVLNNGNISTKSLISGLKQVDVSKPEIFIDEIGKWLNDISGKKTTFNDKPNERMVKSQPSSFQPRTFRVKHKDIPRVVYI